MLEVLRSRVASPAAIVAERLPACLSALHSGPPPSAPVVLRRLFEQLGSTYVKLGQFIASSPTLFPEEYVLEFQKCLDKTPPLPFSTIKVRVPIPPAVQQSSAGPWVSWIHGKLNKASRRRAAAAGVGVQALHWLRSAPSVRPPRPFSPAQEVIEAELGRPLSAVFESVDPVPLASASIAQVHCAVLKGATALCQPEGVSWACTVAVSSPHMRLACHHHHLPRGADKPRSRPQIVERRLC